MAKMDSYRTEFVSTESLGANDLMLLKLDGKFGTYMITSVEKNEDGSYRVHFGPNMDMRIIPAKDDSWLVLH